MKDWKPVAVWSGLVEEFASAMQEAQHLRGIMEHLQREANTRYNVLREEVKDLEAHAHEAGPEALAAMTPSINYLLHVLELTGYHVADIRRSLEKLDLPTVEPEIPL